VALFVVFGGIPLVMALLNRDALVTTFRLHGPLSLPRQLAAIVGAALMGLGLWAWAHESFVIVSGGELDESKVAAARSMVEAMQQTPPWLFLLALAVTPGVIEELCFRGYLFSALARALSPAKTIVVTSLLFGLFHVLTGSSLLLERFVPTTLVGLFLGWVAYRSGSVWPGMALHVIYNGFLNMVAFYKDRLDFLGAPQEDAAHLPLSWLLVTTAITLCGAAVLWAATRGSQAGGARS
jgi:sodium transport system permease protein